MKKVNKKDLYESIMAHVAKNVKKALNEEISNVDSTGYDTVNKSVNKSVYIRDIAFALALYAKENLNTYAINLLKCAILEDDGDYLKELFEDNFADALRTPFTTRSYKPTYDVEK